MSVTPSSHPSIESAFPALIESSNDAICFLDAKGTILGINSLFAARFGKHAQECLDANVFDLISDVLHLPEVAVQRKEQCAKVLRTGQQVRFEDRRGEAITNISISPVRSADGDVMQLLVIIQDVTLYKHLEKASFRKESRLKLALKLARSGLWEWDLITNENTWSDELWILYGLEMNVEAPSFNLWSSTIHPDDREMAIRTALTSIKNETELNLEYRVIHPDGSVHWLMSRGAPLRDERDMVCRYIGMVVDITVRKQIEDELNENRKWMDFALEKSHIGVWNINLRDRTAKRTPEHARIFGYGSENAEWSLNLFLGHILPEDRGDVEILVSNSIQSEQDYAFECRISRLDGEVRWISAKGAFQFDRDGRATHVLGIVEDISERKRDEEEREKLQGQLLHSQKMELVGQLAGGIAHDFNNHLTTILGNIEFVIDEIDGAQPATEYVTYIRQAAQRSAELTKQLLAFARKQTIVPRLLDLNLEIEVLLPMLTRLTDRRIQFDWHPAEGKAFIAIDPSQVDQILTNLCVNAKDAIAGAGRITIATDIVRMTNGSSGEEQACRESGYAVSLSVTDTGSGMAQHVVSHIFEPFYTTKEVGKGTGLGLSTVYGIVQQNKGSITCSTELGQGTTFTIIFPLVQMEAEVRSVSAADPTRSTGKKTILLVIEEEALRSLMKSILENNDFKVVEAGDAEQALRNAAEYPFKIDLLLTDVSLPILNGVDLSHRLHADYPEMETLFMSGFSVCAIDSSPAKGGRCNIIAKPFTIRELIDAVDRSLCMTIRA